ncbi:MAG TPA: histidinol-phosphate transaminase [Acidothermaceae bacterium]
MADEQTPRARADLAGIAVYKPGKPSAVGFKSYKLSSNESPYPPLPSVLEAIAHAAQQANRYPDLAASIVVNALAAKLEVPADHVVVGCGSVGVATQLVEAFAGPGDEVVFAWRSFEAYPIIVQVSGATAVPVPLKAGAVHDLAAMADAVTPRTRVVFVCNPNNPTGTAVRRGELEAFLDQVPGDCLVVLDEAYREFNRAPDVPNGVSIYGDRPNVAVLRTFSKAYGLAGLRVGYAVAHPPVADAIRMTSVPFAVSSIAQAAAVASLLPPAEAELFARVEATVGERARVSEVLAKVGWEVPESEANFVWLATGSSTDKAAARCAEAGIVVRPFSGEGLRVTIGEPEANDIFLAVAADLQADVPKA